MGTSTPGEVTITPIFWTPPGFTAPSSNYSNLVAQLDADLAADSTLRTNVLSTLTDYTSAGGVHLTNLIHAGGVITASDAVATSGVVAGETVVGCNPDQGLVTGAEGDQYSYAGCVTDVQIMAEVEAVRAQHGLPDDTSHLYPVFLPKGLESCFDSPNGTHGGSCELNSSSTPSQYCAYHSSVELGGGAIYSVEPFPVRSTSAGRCDLGAVVTGAPQAPNGDLAFDSAASPYSHEVAEAITDPFGDGWYDAAGNENGDECAYIVPSTLGGTAGAAFDQTINGHHYLLQSEFSNVAYSWNAQQGCLVTADTPPPVVTGLSANRLAVGEQLTLSGTALGGQPIVRIGNQRATVTTDTSAAVVVTVPDGSTGGSVSIQTIAGTATAAGPLLVVTRAAPSLSAASSLAAVTSSPVSTTIAATGYPTPAISLAGALPSGLTFVDAGDGTATIAGTPDANSGGSWPVTLSAHNSEGSAVAPLTIVVHEGAAITSSPTAGFAAGISGSFVITTMGLPMAAVTMTGALPKGLTFTARSDGTAVITGLARAARIGTYVVTIHAANGVGSGDLQSLAVVVGKLPKLTASPKVTVLRGAQMSTSVVASGSPAPTISVLGLESWMHLATAPDGSVTISGRAPSGGASRVISLTLAGRNLIGTVNRSMLVKLR